MMVATPLTVVVAMATAAVAAEDLSNAHRPPGWGRAAAAAAAAAPTRVGGGGHGAAAAAAAAAVAHGQRATYIRELVEEGLGRPLEWVTAATAGL